MYLKCYKSILFIALAAADPNEFLRGGAQYLNFQ